MQISLFYITTQDEIEALLIGETLVCEKIVACANIIPQMRSIYFWNGALQKENEFILILKGPSENFNLFAKK